MFITFIFLLGFLIGYFLKPNFMFLPLFFFLVFFIPLSNKFIF